MKIPFALRNQASRLAIHFDIIFHRTACSPVNNFTLQFQHWRYQIAFISHLCTSWIVFTVIPDAINLVPPPSFEIALVYQPDRPVFLFSTRELSATLFIGLDKVCPAADTRLFASVTGSW